jgi:uracil-DNA glycosylase
MSGWKTLLEQEHKQTYLQDTLSYVAQRRAEGIAVYPEDKHVFEALNATDLDKVKVVILGQDPYHGPKQAHGLCFSVLPGIKPPPSLANMYKELVQDVADFTIPDHGFLLPWAEQGVLLLNTVLTVEQGAAHSHKKLGWERFTDAVIAHVNEYTTGTIFLLWGAHAQKKGKSIDTVRHHVLHAPHPSPLSAHRGFFGCQHFSKTNQLLLDMDKQPINWQV